MKIGSREMGRAMERAGKGTAGADVISSRDNRWLKEFRVALRGGVSTEKARGRGRRAAGGRGAGSGCRVEAVLFSESGRGIGRDWRR